MTPIIYGVLTMIGNVLGGAAVVAGARHSLKLIEGVLAFGAGFMLSVALVDVLPEAYELDGGMARCTCYWGICWFTSHSIQSPPHFHFGERHMTCQSPLVSALCSGLLLHTFFDGVAIAAGFAVSEQLGLLMFLAVMLHKLPEGVTIASVQLAAGVPASKAMASATLLGVATIAGVVATDYVGFLAGHGLALSAGVTIYVAASDLVPAFQHKQGLKLPFFFFLGAGAAMGSDWLLAAIGFGH